jgi:NADPH-dependent 2,4-dienoyl-CoA reductase/sulfur reductase-like enzyme
MTSPNHLCDVVVVGGGPAGIAAAVAAAEGRGRVIILDDNPALGGQIWRGDEGRISAPQAMPWLRRLHRTKLEIFAGARVVDTIGPNTLIAEFPDGEAHRFDFRNLILATGARERFLPFPGWTLPNVMGAGGLQALVKAGLPIAGKRVAVAGTGPLLLAVAAFLRKHGAKVLLIGEQASRKNLRRFGTALMRYPAKFWQAIALQKNLIGVPYLTDCWPLRAEGNNSLELVTFLHGQKTWNVECDYLACGFGLVPNVELGALLGTDIAGGTIIVDDLQRTNVSNIFCAGESTGIGGVDLCLIEGETAGYAAAGMLERAQSLSSKREKHRRFARLLEATFALRVELKSISTAPAFLCRCEDVTVELVREFDDWRTAKLMTRCGMGPCQGRICGPAAEFLFGWNVQSVRPPAFPVKLKTIAGEGVRADFS